MMHSQRQSIYRCPVDPSHEIKAEPAKRVVCPYCKVVMEEVVRGVITKAGVFSGRP